MAHLRSALLLSQAGVVQKRHGRLGLVGIILEPLVEPQHLLNKARLGRPRQPGRLSNLSINTLSSQTIAR